MGQSRKSLESMQVWIQSAAQGGHLQSQGNWDALHFQFLTRWMLLSSVAAHEVCGGTSFDDLKTVAGDICPTFWETCRRRGLLKNDNSTVWNILTFGIPLPHLTTNMRVHLRGDEQAGMFAWYLLSIGDDRYPHTELPDVITLPNFITFWGNVGEHLPKSSGICTRRKAAYRACCPDTTERHCEPDTMSLTFRNFQGKSSLTGQLPQESL